MIPIARGGATGKAERGERGRSSFSKNELRPLSPSSDVDFLVVFESPDLGPWMEKLGRFEEDLSHALGRQADVVLKLSVQSAWNYIRREEILRAARTIYAA